MRLKKYTLQQLQSAVKDNYSLRAVLTELGVAAAGGNYEVLKKAIKLYGINTSHFTGQAHLRGKTHTYRVRPLEDIFVYGEIENTHRMRQRLLKEKIKESKCENCTLDEWLGEPISLELHHVDGDRRNNRLENLKLLCPNCHAQTGNYRGKNKKGVETRRVRPTVDAYGHGIVQTTLPVKTGVVRKSLAR